MKRLRTICALITILTMLSCTFPFSYGFGADGQSKSVEVKIGKVETLTRKFAGAYMTVKKGTVLYEKKQGSGRKGKFSANATLYASQRSTRNKANQERFFVTFLVSDEKAGMCSSS